jgi:flagellar hook-basal body complex protein FliE
MSDPIRIGASSVSPFEQVESPFKAERPDSSFGDMFKKAINDTSNLQDDAKDMIGAFLRGEPVELHQVVAASEEASISLELLVDVRNKLTEAYRAVMNVQ